MLIEFTFYRKESLHFIGVRPIDLAQRRGTQHYELIELKVASDQPLYAAVELLGYTSLWLLAHEKRQAQAPERLSSSTTPKTQSCSFSAT